MTVRHSAFADPELRYRQRYADLAVHPEVRALFRARSRDDRRDPRRSSTSAATSRSRRRCSSRCTAARAARPFTTHHNALDMPLYLRIADELYLKRLIVGGLERVYEIGHDFRNEGIDRTHNPEFTMLEFYEAYADYDEMMARVETLIVRAADAVARVWSPAATEAAAEPARDAARLHAAVPARRVASVAQPRRSACRRAGARRLRRSRPPRARRGVPASKVASLSRPKLLDEMFQALVEPKIESPTFVVDYPLELSPLAKPKRGNPALTERFELFARGQRAGERVQRAERSDRPAAPLRGAGAAARRRRRRGAGVDEDYLRAMEYGMPPTGGVGIGIDRLFMYLTGTANIRDVILFPDACGPSERRHDGGRSRARVRDRLALPAQPARLAARCRSSRVIAIGGIAVGVSALIVIIGVMNGLQTDLREKILVGSPDLRVLTLRRGSAHRTTGRRLLDTVRQAARRRGGGAVRAHAGADAQGPGTTTPRACSSPGSRPRSTGGPPVTTIREHADRRATSGSRAPTASTAAPCSGARLADRLNVYAGDRRLVLHHLGRPQVNAGHGRVRCRAVAASSRSPASSRRGCTSTTTRTSYVDAARRRRSSPASTRAVTGIEVQAADPCGRAGDRRQLR